MNGDRLLIDTNIILYILGGDKDIANYLFEKILYASIISENELLSYQSISSSEIKEVENFLKEIRVVSLDQSIKELVIQMRRKYSLKIPDAIVAATSINLGIPLVTADKGFKKIQELSIDFYNK
ncbi:MAG TPA: type II toxin-antitoxin system VapC family toxin [Hanamia sp.]|nr:type II toxin-antitoxin system VapC family toxin [Hanamia sp.]